jgi:hypothetical protein
MVTTQLRHSRGPCFPSSAPGERAPLPEQGSVQRNSFDREKTLRAIVIRRFKWATPTLRASMPHAREAVVVRDGYGARDSAGPVPTFPIPRLIKTLVAFAVALKVHRPAQPQEISDGFDFNRRFYSRFLDFHCQFDQFQRIEDLRQFRVFGKPSR